MSALKTLQGNMSHPKHLLLLCMEVMLFNYLSDLKVNFKLEITIRIPQTNL